MFVWAFNRTFLLLATGSTDPEEMLRTFIVKIQDYLELFWEKNPEIWKHIDKILYTSCLMISQPLQKIWPHLSSQNQEMIWKHWYGMIRVALGSEETLKIKYSKWFE
jgi:hypothetical protein